MTQTIVLSFFVVIIIGSLLLFLPFASKESGSVSYIDALFTSTSATCVTGLVVSNTFYTFTIFGQIVILVLIQVGGLGFMTIASALYVVFGGKMSLSRRISLQDDLLESSVGKFKGMLFNIVTFTFVIEFIGAVILTACFTKYYSFGEALYRGIFHSVSAFCNAGFDIINIGSGSMTPFTDNPIILITIALLIISGGIGFVVIGDILLKKRFHRFSLHTKIVLCVTAFLIVFGTIGFFFLEYNNNETFGNMTFFDKLINAFFQSVTARTAGFNSVDMASLTRGSAFLMILLMFIGASPASTGGGLKTTTVFVLICAVVMVIRQKNEVVIDKKKIGSNTIFKASSALMLALFTMVFSLFLLSISDASFSFEELLFEQVSAYATVGLSMGITSQLSVFGKFIIVLNMFIGRVSALSFFICFTNNKKNDTKIDYVESNIII